MTHPIHLEWAILAAFVLWNIIGFALYAVDKRRALTNRWRVSERTLMFFMLCGAGIGCWLAMRTLRHKTQKRKFKIGAVIGVAIALVFLVHVGESIMFGRRVVFRELSFSAPNWPQALDGYRIGFITDIHAMPHERVAQIVAELNERDLDVLLLGGDYLTFGNHYQGTLRELSQTVTRDGIWGVEGNHDTYYLLFAAMERYGIRVLDNTGYQLHPGLFLAGVHDNRNRYPDIAVATAGAEPDDFLLILSHSPDVAMDPSNPWFDLMLAGHTHGGQIAIFGFPLYLLVSHITSYGLRFAGGFATGYHEQPVFTSVGAGDYYWPRVFARPEVVVLSMYRGG